MDINKNKYSNELSLVGGERGLCCTKVRVPEEKQRPNFKFWREARTYWGCARCKMMFLFSCKCWLVIVSRFCTVSAVRPRPHSVALALGLCRLRVCLWLYVTLLRFTIYMVYVGVLPRPPSLNLFLTTTTNHRCLCLSLLVSAPVSLSAPPPPLCLSLWLVVSLPHLLIFAQWHPEPVSGTFCFDVPV